MRYTIDDFFDLFKDNELDVEKYFNDYSTFFSILQKHGLINDVDPINAEGSWSWQNEYLLWAFKNNKKKFYSYLDTLLSDVEFDEQMNAYLVISDRGNLSELYYDSRDFSRDFIKRVLSNDSDWYEYCDQGTDDVYRDVIEELTVENLTTLKSYMVNDLKGKNLSPETTEMELIAAEQGHDDFWVLNEENVSRILDDKESMESLMGDELSEMRDELDNIYRYSYNNAYEEEIYGEIWSELDFYFEGNGEFVTRTHPYKSNTVMEFFKIKIKDFEDKVIEFLEHNKGYASGTLEYLGSYLEMLREEDEKLNPRISDYPDFKKVENYINHYFKDYF